MGLIARQTIKGSIASYAGVALGTFTLLFLFPAYLTESQIGLLRIVLNAAGMFSTIAVLGIPQVSVKYLPFIQTTKDYRAYATLLYLAGLVGVLVCYLIFLVFENSITQFYSKNSKELTDYYYLVWSITLLNTLYLIAASYARMNNRIVVPAAIKDVGIRILTIVFFTGIIYNLFDFKAYLNIQIVIYGLALLGVLIYNHQLAPFVPSFEFKRLKGHLKDVVPFAFFSLLTTAASVLVTTIDSLMIGGLINLGEVGIYVIASYIGLVIEMPKRSLNAIAGPSISESWKKNNIEAINQLHQRSSINQIIFGGGMLLLIWAAIDGIFYLMPNGEIYASGKYVVLFIGLAKFTDLAFGLTAEIISFSPKYKYNLYLLISLSVIAVLTNYLLIPILGITGAGLATFISYLIYNLLSYWLMYNRYKISPFSNDSIKAILLLSALFITISFLNFTNHSLINSGVKILFSIALLFIGIKKMNIRSDVYILSDRILKYIQGIFRRK
ncbi:oligosaccharide flippase family protein [Schleiferia thermophila]|uniref:O-antigen/teichoic acid export membrane protein n=1 Tax=Schleiferia thermophila TaxID=884107 RepID=A0A369ABX9_9FLAO|nr:polysaccharide biosynthesis C-terminal domain-containing protein [Schleiferia thermophila]KFD40338.1 hypothetical protein AT05_01895 [Schleiferia thermophila str. Yellowstone]RCX05597.1 O-antigen/teichoic acid export membrane protein [Schleiferia thermophila]GCD78908.1 hypothetical protein JCM30197_01550 [Schleiferia thermophila]